MARGKSSKNNQSAQEVQIIAASQASYPKDDWSEAYSTINAANAIIASGGHAAIAAAYAKAANGKMSYKTFCDPIGVGSFYAGWPKYVEAHGIDGGRIDSKDGTKTRFFQSAYMGELSPIMEQCFDEILPGLRSANDLDGSAKGLHRHGLRQTVLKEFMDEVPAKMRKDTAIKALKGIVTRTANKAVDTAVKKRKDAEQYAVGMAAKKIATSIHSMFTKTGAFDAVFLDDADQAAIAKAQEILLRIAKKQKQLSDDDARKKRIHVDSIGTNAPNEVVDDNISWKLGVKEPEDDDDGEHQDIIDNDLEAITNTTAQPAQLPDGSDDEMARFFMMYKKMKSSGNL